MSFKVVSGVGGGPDYEAELSQVDAQLVLASIWTEDDLIKNAGDADAVMVGTIEPYTRRVIEAMTKCRVISRLGVGYDNIDLEAATEQGIAVAYVPDASIIEVSDHAVALLLALSRKLIPVDRAAKNGLWQVGKLEIFVMRMPMFRLSEQTIGVVGAGRIGSVFVRKARAFVARVIVYDPYLSAETVEKMGAEQVDFESLLRESDFISVHAPATEETKHLFSLEEFKKMKPTAFIINTARGEIIDEAALFTALSEGYIAGAGLDVTYPEPPDADNPLLKLENIIVSAHSAFYSDHSFMELRRRTLEAVVRALRGEWPRDLVNPEVTKSSNRRI